MNGYLPLFGGVPEQTSPQNLNVLRRLAGAVACQGVRFCEVGCWLGQSTSIWASCAKRNAGTICAVDHWQGAEGMDAMMTWAREHDVYALFHENMVKLGLWEAVRPYTIVSDEAAERFRDGCFDLCYLDGAHSYSQVCRDIGNYLPKVCPGGILCGHDCEILIAPNEALPLTFTDFLEENKELDCVRYLNQTLHPGVILAVSRLLSDVQLENSIWWMRKRGVP